MVKIDNDTRKQIVKIASTNPRELGLKFSTWSLRSLAGYLTKDKKTVKQGISHTRIKEILNESKIEWRNSITVLVTQRSRIRIKKNRIEELDTIHLMIQDRYIKMRKDQ